MKNILISIFVLITFSAFSQGGLLKPRYIGWPVDSFQNLTLKWNPSTFKAEWVVDGAGGDSTTFVGDSVCIVNMGVETCISLDSVYFTDTSFCYIQLPDTTCIDWNSSNGNIYNISGTLTGHRTLQQGSYSLQFSRSNNTLYGSTYWSQPGLWPIMSLSGGLVPNDASPTFSISSNGQDGDQYQLFNGPSGADYSIGVRRSATLNPFTIAEGEDLGGSTGRPMMQFHSVGDSIVIANDLLTSGSALKIRSLNTGAASNTQYLLDLVLRGANATASQTTRALNVVNAHSGTSATNYGVYSRATTGSTTIGVYGSGDTYGVQGISSGGRALYGQSSGAGYGVYGESSTGIPVYGYNTSSGLAMAGLIQTVSTNTLRPLLRLGAQSLGNAAPGFGTATYLMASIRTFGLDTLSIIKSVWTDTTYASRKANLTFRTMQSGVTADVLTLDGNKSSLFYGRVQASQGTDVASVAGAIALGTGGNVFEITGTNAITLISNVGWQNGSEVTLFFTSTASLTDGTANSGTDIGMELNGNANFTGSADDSVTLVLSEIGGTQRWREKCRSVN